MAAEAPPPLREPAPAKLNLYLHVTGRRDDGYHLLDSLVIFADAADRINITVQTRHGDFGAMAGFTGTRLDADNAFIDFWNFEFEELHQETRMGPTQDYLW